jgi:hypothetical protein
VVEIRFYGWNLLLFRIVNRHMFMLGGFRMPVRVGIRDEAASDRTAGHRLFGNCFLAHVCLSLCGHLRPPVVSENLSVSVSYTETERKYLLTKEAGTGFRYKNLDNGGTTGRLWTWLRRRYTICCSTRQTTPTGRLAFPSLTHYSPATTHVARNFFLGR